MGVQASGSLDFLGPSVYGNHDSQYWVAVKELQISYHVGCICIYNIVIDVGSKLPRWVYIVIHVVVPPE